MLDALGIVFGHIVLQYQSNCERDHRPTKPIKCLLSGPSEPLLEQPATHKIQNC